MDFVEARNREFFGKARCVQGTSDSHLGVLHQTQGATARGGAITLTTRTDGSAHVCLDWDENFIIAEDEAILCGVAGANTGVWHLEMAGSSFWERVTWFRKKHKRMLKYAAHEMAQYLLRNNLPLRWYTTADLDRASSLANCNGYTCHWYLSRSNKSTSTHTDPGAAFPYKWWRRYVEFYYRNRTIHEPVDVGRKGNLKPKRRSP